MHKKSINLRIRQFFLFDCIKLLNNISRFVLLWWLRFLNQQNFDSWSTKINWHSLISFNFKIMDISSDVKFYPFHFSKYFLHFKNSVCHSEECKRHCRYFCRQYFIKKIHDLNVGYVIPSHAATTHFLSVNFCLSVFFHFWSPCLSPKPISIQTLDSEIVSHFTCNWRMIVIVRRLLNSLLLNLRFQSILVNKTVVPKLMNVGPTAPLFTDAFIFKISIKCKVSDTRLKFMNC